MVAEKKNILVLINPIAGIRSKDNLPALILETLDTNKFNINIVLTEYAGHATELAHQAALNHTDYVLAIGGDGTINETAKALIHTDTALGIIPSGSGNGLARHLGISMETAKALALINEEKVIAIDYCKANDHIFFCTAGLGFDALISKKFAEEKLRGGLTYLKSALIEYLKYQPKTYTIKSTSGCIEQKAFLIACANASQYGNNAYIAPGANMQDGKMDVTILKPFSPLDAPQLALQLFTKKIQQNNNIECFQDESIHITLEKPEVMHVDGEPILMDKEVEIKTIPHGLKILIPSTPSHSLIEPIQHVIEEIHYNIISDIKEVFTRNK